MIKRAARYLSNRRVVSQRSSSKERISKDKISSSAFCTIDKKPERSAALGEVSLLSSINKSGSPGLKKKATLRFRAARLFNEKPKVSSFLKTATHTRMSSSKLLTRNSSSESNRKDTEKASESIVKKRIQKDLAKYGPLPKYDINSQLYNKLKSFAPGILRQFAQLNN